MRIALLHPTYWPEVRRGSERLIHDLAGALAERGHGVTILTTHPGPRSVAIDDGIHVDRARRWPQRGPLRWYEHHVTVAPAAAWRLSRGDFDLAHCFFVVDSWAAVKARSRGGPPVLASFHGVLDREWLVKRRYRLEMHAEVAARADAVSVLSAAAAAPFGRYLGRAPLVLSGGVKTADFVARGEPDPAPTIVCAASLGDPRKRGALLFEAFARLRRERADARLLVARTRDPVLSEAIDSLPEGADWAPGSSTEDLAALYRRGWASVLPSVDEAFGLVLVESLAAGRPVVAARSGACPEIVGADSIGRLFEPDDPGSLASNLSEALDLAQRPETREACRRAAERWDWSRVVDRYEEVYEELVRGRVVTSGGA